MKVARRQFTKSLGSVVVLSALKPELVWPSEAPQVSAKATFRAKPLKSRKRCLDRVSTGSGSDLVNYGRQDR